MPSPNPHLFDHPVWELRDVIGWVLDRDRAQFGRIHDTEDARSAVWCARFHKSTERDANALRTILHALQSGELSAHGGDAPLPRTHWGAATEIDLRSAISRGLWFWREDVLMLWPAESQSGGAADQPSAGASRGRGGRKVGSGSIPDEPSLRKMLRMLAAGEAPSAHAAAKVVADESKPAQSVDATTGRLRRKFSKRWGTKPPEGKTWADVEQELDTN